MTATRRALLGSGVVAGAALLAGCDDAQAPSAPTSTSASAAPSFDPGDWDSVRSQFLLDAEMAQFAAFVLSPHTAALQAAIDGYRDELAVDTEAALQAGSDRVAAVRAAAAAYAGGTPEQYALTESTTMGIATMYGGLSLEPGDEVLTTTHDFYSTEASLDLLARRTGARIRRVSLYDDPATATADEMTDRLVAGVGPRTRVVAVTWVHSSTGVRLPVEQMGAALSAHRESAGESLLFCVDGVHGLGAVDIDLPALGCDFLAAGTHKWLFGPRGTGILWARDWTPVTELIPTFELPQGPGRLTRGGYQAFEHQWAAADAFDLMGRIGRARIAERTAEQATQMKEGLAGVERIRLVTPAAADVSAGIVCLEVPGMLPADGVLTLRDRGIVASATPYAQSFLRLGPSIVTDPAQVDAVVEAVAELA